jgi:transposase
MLKPRSPQASFYGSYLYDKIIPVDHLLRKINQVVDFSFIRELVKDKYTEDFGRPAEDPEFMLRLCLLQYLYGDSDRGVIENARMNLAYKYFLGLAIDEEVPDDTTVSYFRVQRLGEAKFRQVFKKIVQQCHDKGLVKGKRQIIDSTHIIADMAVTSLTGLIKLCRRNVLNEVAVQNPETADKMGLKELKTKKQDKFIKMEEGLAEEIKQAEKLLDEVTQELKTKKLKVTPELQKDLGLLEKAVEDRVEGATDRLVSPIDPEARAGKKEHKNWAGYKGHMIVEEESEIVTAIETTPANTEDSSQTKPLLDQQQQAVNLKPESLSGDKAYGTGANLQILESRKITGYISLKEKYNRMGDLFTQDEFQYDEARDTLICPAGCKAPPSRRDLVLVEGQQRFGRIFQFTYRQCHECELKPLCYIGVSRHHGRAIHISYFEPYYKQMKARMESEEGKAAYRNRYKIEHKVADLARWCGMRRCRYRGLEKAKIHTLLAAIVSNVKRMTRLVCPRNGKVCPLLGLTPLNSMLAS